MAGRSQRSARSGRPDLRTQAAPAGEVRALEARGDARAADIMPTIAELQAAGATALRAIAAGLNARRIPTARGDGDWSAVQVKRVLDRA
jgi:hypothetical protein